MSQPDEGGDRPVVSGSEADGPIEPGGAGAGPEVAQDYSVSGDAEPGASYADPSAGRMAGEDAPKAPNQAKTEPIPPSPEHDDVPVPAAGTPDDAGTATGPGPREGWATAPPSSEGAGDANGVPVPSDTSAEGTSEGVAPVEGVTFPAIAPESLADGETDVAMPSTTSF
ncbi:MAG TPA: hypothetical protein VNA20_15565 [Frankiaceae bacterium]|nr:hypothetical protein [Frankiaceae bacterium]